MYYRVKRFIGAYTNMYVLDRDTDLTRLKSRASIDCAGIGPKSFNSPQYIESQEMRCTSLGGITRNSDIIKED